MEGAVALLASHHQIARIVQLGDDLGARITGQIVAQNAAAGLARVVVGGLPEGIGGNLGRIPVFRDHVQDGHRALAQPGQERGRRFDEGPQRSAGKGKSPPRVECPR